MARKRRTARQSENIREYRRLRRNLMARLRYREKQGFKVDYTTLPKSLENATKSDIEKISKAQVKKNRYGEIVITTQKRASMQYQDISRQDVISQKQLLKELNQEGADTITTSSEPPVATDLDYINMVVRKLNLLKQRAEAYMNEFDPEYGMLWNAEQWYNAWMGVYENLINIVDVEYMRVDYENLDAYYKLRYEDISTCISNFLNSKFSTPDEVTESDEHKQLEFILIYPKGE